MSLTATAMPSAMSEVERSISKSPVARSAGHESLSFQRGIEPITTEVGMSLYVFDMKKIMSNFTPYFASLIEERIILQDEVLMSQIRPAMEAVERGTFLDVAIPHKRTTRPNR